MEHVADWTVHIYLFEHDDDSTYARAELKTSAATLTRKVKHTASRRTLRCPRSATSSGWVGRWWRWAGNC